MTIEDAQFEDLKQIAINAARKAGAYIAQKSINQVKVEHKEGSESEAFQVVTEVDRKAQSIILEELVIVNNQYDFGLLTEEREDDKSRFKKDYFWCIDPLDGTLPFIESLPGYSVSIALVSKAGDAVLGVIYDPARDILYHAVAGKGAFKQASTFSVSEIKPSKKFTWITDRSLIKSPQFNLIAEKCLQFSKDMHMDGLEIIQHGGAALNACWVIDHSPAVYFKFPKRQPGGGSMWDFAASSCIVKEAGGMVTDMYGNKLDLNKKENTFMNHIGVLYASDDSITEFVKELFESLNE